MSEIVQKSKTLETELWGSPPANLPDRWKREWERYFQFYGNHVPVIDTHLVDDYYLTRWRIELLEEKYDAGELAAVEHGAGRLSKHPDMMFLKTLKEEAGKLAKVLGLGIGNRERMKMDMSFTQKNLGEFSNINPELVTDFDIEV